MIAQNDRNKILSQFYLVHLTPGCLEKNEKWQKRDFCPQKAQKIEKFSQKSKIFEKISNFFWLKSI